MPDFKYTAKSRIKFNPKRLKELLVKNLSGQEISKELNISEATLYRYLNYLNLQKPKIKLIGETEITDLALLGAKARMELSTRIETMTPIELIALVDRTFQQRRLLEGKSTENIALLSAIVSEAHTQIRNRIVIKK